MGFVDPIEDIILCTAFTSQLADVSADLVYSPSNPFTSNNLVYSIECTSRKRRHGSLHSNLYGLEWTQSNIGKEFG